jgi:hypothetical protein
VAKVTENCVTAFRTKLAVTVVVVFNVIEQLTVVLLQPIAFPLPLVHPVKVESLLAVALMTTGVPSAYCGSHAPKAPPLALHVTVPVPVPALEIDNVEGGGTLNVAVILESAVKVNVQAPDPLHAAALPVPPLHPANPEPVGVNVTEKLLDKTAVQAPLLVPLLVLQLMPTGVEATLPLPAPAIVTATVENELCRWAAAVGSEANVIPTFCSVVSKFGSAKLSVFGSVDGIV